MTKKKKAVIITSCISAFLVVAIFLGILFSGMYVGWGPFGFMEFDREQSAILKKYDSKTRQNEIVFYGASNFRLWTEMDSDLSEYKVQNHGFGGSTDKDLVERADKLLYPYNPQIVFFQTGSNDYVSIKGSDEEKISKCMEYKKQMFSTFHEKLPDSYFVVMSGLLLPGRSQYTALTKKINSELKELCNQYDYMTFVDAEVMTYNGNNFASELFVKDGIHLNHTGQLKWKDEYIKPIIENLIIQYDLQNLRNSVG